MYKKTCVFQLIQPFVKPPDLKLNICTSITSRLFDFKMHFGDAQWQKLQKRASAFVQQILDLTIRFWFILYIHALQVEMYFFCLWNCSADTIDVNKLLTLKEVSSVTYIYGKSDIPNAVYTYSSRPYPDLLFQWSQMIFQWFFMSFMS